MAYKVARTQPKSRAADLAWEDPAPGLYDDGEVLVDLGNGLVAAVSSKITWLENGSGVNITGVARWCEKDGTTHLTPDGQHVETFASLNVDPITVKTYSLAALSKEVLLALLGQDPQLKRDQPEDDGTTTRVPVIQFSDEGRLNMSIQHAAVTVNSARNLATPLALLS